MTSEVLRRKAEVCLRVAERAEDQEIASRLKIMAGEYLVKAELADDGIVLIDDESYSAQPKNTEAERAYGHFDVTT